MISAHERMVQQTRALATMPCVRELDPETGAGVPCECLSCFARETVRALAAKTNTSAPTNHADLLDFHGVSRSVLERRIVDLVAVVESFEKKRDDLERRLQGRVDMAGRNISFHGEHISLGRLNAYRTALDDLREHMPTVQKLTIP
jgi:hypothetical protein